MKIKTLSAILLCSSISLIAACDEASNNNSADNADSAASSGTTSSTDASAASSSDATTNSAVTTASPDASADGDYTGEETPTAVFTYSITQAEENNWKPFFHRLDAESKKQMEEMLDMLSLMAQADPTLAGQIKGKQGAELFSAIMSASPELQEGLNFRGVKVVKEVFAEDGLSATITIQYPNGESTGTDTIPMVQQEGKWYFVMQ